MKWVCAFYMKFFFFFFFSSIFLLCSMLSFPCACNFYFIFDFSDANLFFWKKFSLSFLCFFITMVFKGLSWELWPRWFRFYWLLHFYPIFADTLLFGFCLFHWECSSFRCSIQEMLNCSSYYYLSFFLVSRCAWRGNISSKPAKHCHCTCPR